MEGIQVTSHGRYTSNVTRKVGSNVTWEEYKLRHMEDMEVISHGRYGSNITWKEYK